MRFGRWPSNRCELRSRVLGKTEWRSDGSKSCRRGLLDHVIAMNESHLKRLLREYVCYYHDDRTQLGFGKGTPNCRTGSTASGGVLSFPRLGGLCHRYDRAA